MKRIAPFAWLSVLIAPLVLVAARPSAGDPTPLIDAHRALFAALDRGDAEAAAKHFTTSSVGVGLDEKGRFTASPGALFHVPGGEDPARRLAARFAGGSTRIVGGWSDCPRGELSWAALELEHTPAEGPAQRWRSTSLSRHEKGGFRLYLWHLSPDEGVKLAAR